MIFHTSISEALAEGERERGMERNSGWNERQLIIKARFRVLTRVYLLMPNLFAPSTFDLHGSSSADE